ncbi:MAG: hypothetical protein WAW37_06900 [Syntrophobacteraceae bacterium]
MDSVFDSTSPVDRILKVADIVELFVEIVSIHKPDEGIGLSGEAMGGLAYVLMLAEEHLRMAAGAILACPKQKKLGETS